MPPTPADIQWIVSQLPAGSTFPKRPDPTPGGAAGAAWEDVLIDAPLAEAVVPARRRYAAAALLRELAADVRFGSEADGTASRSQLLLESRAATLDSQADAFITDSAPSEATARAGTLTSIDLRRC